ncbi:CD0519/CD1768 family membrane protein [Terrisporobacter petrolearius]|uniref:CD0519/CD1768 family membrane protein n=1 Tax=Terrisporobacter petrolearius TaxID=1460447 RepID=UPI0031CC8B50
MEVVSKNELNQKKKNVSLETFVFLAILIGGFGYVGSVMGAGTMFKVIMATAHDLLLNTVFLIMSMAVLAGALSALLSEFGVISLLNKMFAMFMKPLYGLPGASIAGAITTYLSDNPAIIAFAKDKSFTKYFKDYQIPALCNIGTAFGMGLIVTTFMISQGSEFVLPALVGNLGAIIGSIVSVRIMLHFTKKYYKYDGTKDGLHKSEKIEEVRQVRSGNVFQRSLEAMLEGGKNGVELGMAIIPGVLIVCTLVMILTFGPSIDPETGQSVYKGVAYEGIRLLPMLGDKLSFILEPLFGFTSPEAIAFPITSLGAVGAAMSLVPKFITDGIVTPNDIAVFTAMGMCWSGYLSTHVGMMDALDARPLTGKAILSHTIGGLCAGMSAHFIFMILA